MTVWGPEEGQQYESSSHALLESKDVPITQNNDESIGQPDYRTPEGRPGIVIRRPSGSPTLAPGELKSESGSSAPPEMRIDRNHDVPLLAAALDDGHGFYGIAVDRRIPHAFTNQGITYDPAQFVYGHEQVEHADMEANGTPYQQAHDEIATPMEKEMVQDFAKSKGVDPEAFWKEHQRFWTSHLPQANAAVPEQVHPHTYMKPYEDSNHPHTNPMKEAIRNYDFEGREDEAIKAQGKFAESTVGRIGEGVANVQGLIPGDPLGLANFIGLTGGMLNYKPSASTIVRASEMEKAGFSRDIIFKKTNWFRGSDGHWRYELPTTSMFLKGSAEGYKVGDKFTFSHGSDTGKFEDFFDYPELLEAYPSLKNMDVELTSSKRSLGTFIPGSYSKTGTPKLIIQKGMDYQDSVVTVAHELQHAIQSLEDFPSKGSSPDWASKQAISQLRRKLEQTPVGSDEEKRLVSLIMRIHADRMKYGGGGFSRYLYERNPGEIEANLAAARKLTGSQGIDPITHRDRFIRAGWMKPESWALEDRPIGAVKPASMERLSGEEGRNISFPDLPKIKEMYEKGLSYKEIGEALGRPRNSIAGIINRQGWTKNKPTRVSKPGSDWEKRMQRKAAQEKGEEPTERGVPSLPRLKFLEKPFEEEE